MGKGIFNKIMLSDEEKNFFREFLGQDEAAVHLIQKVFSGKKLVGIAGVIFRYLFVPSFFLVVSESFSGKGFGQTLTSLVLKKWGSKPLFLTAPVSNKPAIHIYKKFGFRKIAGWRKIRGKEMILMFRL